MSGDFVSSILWIYKNAKIIAIETANMALWYVTDKVHLKTNVYLSFEKKKILLYNAFYGALLK